MTPITIPAIAPGLNPLLLPDLVIGMLLPLAVAGGVNGAVMVAETTVVAVEMPPLVGRKGADPIAEVEGT